MQPISVQAMAPQPPRNNDRPTIIPNDIEFLLDRRIMTTPALLDQKPGHWKILRDTIANKFPLQNHTVFNLELEYTDTSTMEKP